MPAGVLDLREDQPGVLQQPQPRRRRPKGKRIRWTEADQEALAQPTPTDVKAADAAVSARSTTLLDALYNAKPYVPPEERNG